MTMNTNQPSATSSPSTPLSWEPCKVSVEAGGGEQEGRASSTTVRRVFGKELRCMMYGFGDDANPYLETVELIEDLVVQFVGEMAVKALAIGTEGRITIDDLLFTLRRDARKYARLKELLEMNNELRQARKAFDEVKYIDRQ